MGLKVLLRPGETHQLFEDEMYAKSQEWKLSSSGLTAGERLMGGQFGSAWPDGYSVSCKFGHSALASFPFPWHLNPISPVSPSVVVLSSDREKLMFPQTLLVLVC